MTIHVVCQRSFARGHLGDDTGEQVFMLCNHGLAKLIGHETVRSMYGRRLLRSGDEFTMIVNARGVGAVKKGTGWTP